MSRQLTNYLWYEPYWDAIYETDHSSMDSRILEALAAIEQRLLAPVEFNCDEDRAIKSAERALRTLRAEWTRKPNGVKGPISKSAQPQILD
jgi:hypothetical protein